MDYLIEQLRQILPFADTSPWDPWDWLEVASWIVRIVMLFVVTRRRRPTSAMAWLGVIFFAPWLGLALYLLIGATGLPRRRLRHHDRLRTHVEGIGERLTAQDASPVALTPPHLTGLGQLVERISHHPTTRGNDFELIDVYEHYYDRLITDIENARDFIHLYYYIFADDDTGRRVADALVRAVNRGVEVRLLADAVGSRPAHRSLFPKLRDQGVEARAALPVNPFRRRLARIDLRNHRKIVVIDGQLSYTGSQNVIDRDYHYRNLIWSDLGIRLTGPIVHQLHSVFVEDWYYESEVVLTGDRYFPTVDASGPHAIQAIASRPNVPASDYQHVVITGLYAALDHILLTTPYFIPDDPLLQALEAAVRRGVRVDLIMPEITDHSFALWARRGYYTFLFDAGVNIYHYKRNLLHTKSMSVDGAVAMAGSSNLDIRSLALNYEVNLVFFGEKSAAPIVEQQRKYLDDSELVTAGQWHERPLAQRKFEDVMRILSPLL